MAARTARLTGGAAALALGLLFAGALGGRAAGTVATHAREAGAARAAAASTRVLAASVDGVRHSVAALALLAPSVAAAPATPPLALRSLLDDDGAVSGIVVVPASGAPLLAAGRLPASVTLPGIAEAMRAPFDIARDTGDPHAGAVARGIAVAVPVYRGAPISTEQRRTSLTAWVVAVVDPSALVATAVAPGDRTVLRLGGVAVTAETPRGTASAATTVDLAGQPLEAVVSPRVDGGAGAAVWVVIVFACAGAAAVLTVGLRASRALGRATAENDALEREARTVAELGPLLQQSLDLAEVLPAVAVRLSDEFALESFAVELVGEQGSLVDVFGVGRRRGDTAPYVPANTEGIPAGVDVALPLLRAGRTIGRLCFVARRPLTPTQADGLRGAADLIAVATYNVELYEREQGSVRRLQELDRLKDAFLGTISHELRTPITAIGGFVRMLNERWDDLTEEQRRDFLRRVGRNSTSLGMLVDDLLDFARLERQALSAQATPTPLDTVVAAFVAQVVPALGDHPIETHLQPGVQAMADPRALERVLANLLTNAAKFSPAGAPVEVSLGTDGEWAVVTVADHGPGIAAEDRLRVFTRFYRGDSEAARSTRGAGIGLSVVHELVTQMGGSIEVLAREPHGTAMVVRLPLVPGAPEPRPPSDELVPARSTT